MPCLLGDAYDRLRGISLETLYVIAYGLVSWVTNSHSQNEPTAQVLKYSARTYSSGVWTPPRVFTASSLPYTVFPV